jgi:hypothetical protein
MPNVQICVMAAAIGLTGAIVPTVSGAPLLIKTCQTIAASGSYVVDNNLTANGDCLVLAADDVTIDLNGFTIAGQGTGAGVKTNGAVRTNIAIHGGTIRHFESGIALAGDGVSVTIENMRILDNSNVGGGGNDQTTIRNSVFSGNGVGLVAGSRSLVVNNTADYNYDGVSVGTGSTILGNTSSANQRDGFQLHGASTISGNTAQANKRYGFMVECRSNLIGNTAVLNTVQNLRLDTGAGACQLVNNLFPPTVILSP